MKNEEKQWDDDLDWIPNQTNRYSPIKNKNKKPSKQAPAISISSTGPNPSPHLTSSVSISIHLRSFTLFTYSE